MPDLGLSSLEMAFAVAVILLAYFVFGVTGFGSAIVAVPLLTHVLPLQEAVPQIVFLDLITGFLMGQKNFNVIDKNELKWLMPFVLVGMVIGVTLLIRAPAEILLGVLAIFTLYSGVNGLRQATQFREVCGRWWGLVTGLIAGGFSALYGTGGPIYAIYLSRRIHSTAALRATMSSIIFLNVIFRLITFSLAGLLLTPSNLWRTALFIPFAILALTFGSKFQSKLNPKSFKQFFSAVLIFSALTILPKVFIG